MQFVLKIQQAEKGSVRRGVCTIGAWSEKAGARRRTRMPKPHRQRCVYIVVVAVVVPHMCLCRCRWYLKSTYPPSLFLPFFPIQLPFSMFRIRACRITTIATSECSTNTATTTTATKPATSAAAAAKKRDMRMESALICLKIHFINIIVQ